MRTRYTMGQKDQGNSKGPHRAILIGGVSLISLISTNTAFAQQEETTLVTEEIVVTGSRIARPEVESVAPVTAITAQAIALSGKTNIEDLLSETPSLVGSSGSFETNENGALTGVNFLNLRNLGSNRTLVLVNGRRHVGADATGVPAVDTNSIPTALIERVDVLTGGVSAIYGADAVSGVVNFVLKQDFEGLAAQSQYGLSDRGDADEIYNAITVGKNFADGRGNITSSFEYRHNEKLLLNQRRFGSVDPRFLVNNPEEFNSGNDDPNIPDQVIARDLRFVFTSPSGRYDIFGFDTVAGRDLEFGDLILNARGEAFDEGTFVSGFTALGGDGTPVNAFNPEFFPKTASYTFNQTANYQFTDKVRGFAELKYVRTKARNAGEPSFTSYLTLGLDNPFIPQAIQDVLATIDDPFINVARDDLELRPTENNRRETYRAVIGFDGEINDWLSYEVSFNHGITKVNARLQNLRREDRYFAAYDAVLDPNTGQATCRSNLDPSAVPPIDPVVSSFNPDAYPATFTPGPNSGCLPFNPFIAGVDNAEANAAALAWITGNGEDVVDRGKVTQTVISGFLTGNTSGFGLELPAGPVDYVFGGEYRKERTRNDVSALRNDLNALTFFGVEQDVRASFDVAEFFTEASIPIIADGGPLLQSLTLNTAYRFSDYSTIGSTHAYSFGGTWEVIDDLRIRGSYGRSVRAPNLFELFSPSNENFFGPEDVCDSTNADAQSANTLANCAAELSGLGIDPSTFVPSSAVLRSGVVVGNPDLEEEKGKTYTVGAVIQPRFAEGLTLTVDYWSIALDQGILQPDPDNVVERCYDAPSLDNQFCALFSRDTSDNDGDGEADGIIQNFISIPVNVSQLKTTGIDFTATYQFDLPSDGFIGRHFNGDPGNLSFRLSGSHLLKLETQPSLAPDIVEEAGQTSTLLGGSGERSTGAPQWTLNLDTTWQRGPLSVNYGINYQSSLDLFTRDERERDPDISAFLSTRRLLVHDLQANYDVNDRFRVYAGVQNLADRKPDPTFFSLPVGPTGRYFYFGVNVNFDSLGDVASIF